MAQKETQWRLTQIKQEEELQTIQIKAREQTQVQEDQVQELQMKVLDVVKEHSIQTRRNQELQKLTQNLKEERKELQQSISTLNQAITSGQSMEEDNEKVII